MSLIYLEGKPVSLSLINVTMKNITQQTILWYPGIPPEIFTLPRGICCQSIRNSRLVVRSSNFSEIGSHCFGLQDTLFTFESSIFDNSRLLAAKENSIVREDASSLDEYSGVSWLNVERTSYFYGKIDEILIQDTKFIKNGMLAKSGGVIGCNERFLNICRRFDLKASTLSRS